MQQEVFSFIQSLKNQLAHLNSTAEQKATNGQQVVEIMNRIAQRGTAFREIEDPVVWQREIRKDRPLPGRET